MAHTTSHKLYKMKFLTLGNKALDKATIRETIRAYIIRELIHDTGYDLMDDEGIITGSLMDSFALAELGVFIEEEFDVYIPDPDLTVEKMDTLDLIVTRVMRDIN